jgi:hypothetical protein
MNFRIELWKRQAEHIRWTIAASGSIVLARAAFDAAAGVAARALHTSERNYAHARASAEKIIDVQRRFTL